MTATSVIGLLATVPASPLQNCDKNFEGFNLPDRIAWINATAKRYLQMDLSRVGVFGGSFGGPSTPAARSGPRIQRLRRDAARPEVRVYFDPLTPWL